MKISKKYFILPLKYRNSWFLQTDQLLSLDHILIRGIHTGIYQNTNAHLFMPYNKMPIFPTEIGETRNIEVYQRKLI